MVVWPVLILKWGSLHELGLTQLYVLSFLEQLLELT